MRVNFTIDNKLVIALFVGLMLALVWLYGRSVDDVEAFNIPQIISESESCDTSAAGNNQDTFVAFITSPSMATNLLEQLCRNPAVNRQFGTVVVRWSHNEQDMIQYVGKGLADLALVKENVMQAFATLSTHRYRVVAHYQNYATYLISLKEKPRIDKQYLWGKRLGLLDYPSSRSGHMVPKRMLAELEMTVDDLEIVYANSHYALRDLLASGEVDLISSYWQDEDEQRFSADYKTPIESNVSGSKWYLKMEMDNTDLFCSVQQTLVAFAASMQSNYYSNLTVHPGCPQSSMTEQP